MEEHLITWLNSILGLEIYYQHTEDPTESEFVWVTRSGDEELDTLDQSGEPDIVYFDLELYCETTTSLQAKTALLRAQRDFRGQLDTNQFVDDIQIQDQRDDYEPDCYAENLPVYLAAFQLVVSGYEDQS